MTPKIFIILLTSFWLINSSQLRASSFIRETITIGLTASLSGKFREAGTQQLKGVEMWRDDINERGALLGKRVKLIVQDDHSIAEDAAEIYETFILKDKVDLLLGPYSSDITNAVAKVTDKFNFPLLAIAASASSVWDKSNKPYLFGTYVQSDQLMTPVIKLAAAKKIRRIAIAYANTRYTNSIAQGARRVAQENNMDVIFYEMFNATNDFREYVERLAETKPEIIIVGAYLEDSIQFVKALKQHKVIPKMLVFSGSIDTDDFRSALGNDVEAVLSAVQWSQSQRLPGAYDFAFRYKQKNKVYPSYQAAGGYAAGQILEAAVRLSGSLSKKDLQEQLLKLKFRSLFGHYRVDSNGQQIGKKAYLMQWQDGERRLVMPKDLTNHTIRLFNIK